MLPHDHETSLVSLPAGDRRSLVLVTSTRPGYLRLGYLLQQRVPGLLAAWFIAPSEAVPSSEASRAFAGRLASSASGAAIITALKAGELAEAARMVRRQLRPAGLRRMRRQLQRRRAASSDDLLVQVETGMFGDELTQLRARATLHPVDAPVTRETIGPINPYIIVAHGTTIPADIARLARGLVLTQHDGWLGALSGPHAVEHALYHRELSWVGSTITAQIAGQGEAAIVRRSSATLHPDDTVAHCVAAAAALGASLMLDSIDQALTESHLPLAPVSGGRTLVPADFSAAVQEALARDFAAGWLADALGTEQDF